MRNRSRRALTNFNHQISTGSFTEKKTTTNYCTSVTSLRIPYHDAVSFPNPVRNTILPAPEEALCLWHDGLSRFCFKNNTFDVFFWNGRHLGSCYLDRVFVFVVLFDCSSWRAFQIRRRGIDDRSMATQAGLLPHIYTSCSAEPPTPMLPSLLRPSPQCWLLC